MSLIDVKTLTARTSLNYTNMYNLGTSAYGNLPSLSSTSLYDIYRQTVSSSTNNTQRTTSNYRVQTPNYHTRTSNNPVRVSDNIGNSITNIAKSYLGYKESDGSYKLFTNGRQEAWCADFVTHVVKEAYRKQGKSAPQGFGSPSVEGLRQWGKNNNCYFDITNSSNKSTAIASNIKIGDVVIFKENGTSHTGVVTKINSDGSFQTIEGNTSNKVAYRNYAANDKKISGFVQVA